MPSNRLPPTEPAAAQEPEKDPLRESEARAATILNNVVHLQGLLTRDGILIEANAAALSMIDADIEALAGRPFWDCPWWTHDPEIQARVRGAIEKAALGETVNFLTTHPAPDGSTRYIDFRITPVRGETGEVDLLVPEGHDVTQFKEAEQRVQESEARLRIALENMPGAMWVVDDDLVMVLANEQYKDFYGDSEGLVKPGSAMAEILRAEAENRLLGSTEIDIDGIVEDRLKSFRAEAITTFEDRTPDGRFIKLIRNPTHKGFIVSVATDITDLKEAESALARINAELQELNELKNRFLGMAAHDLRNPLSAIKGMSQLILELDLDRPKKEEFIASINRISGQMLDLINDLLDVSAIESGKFELEMETGDLGAVLQQRIDLVAYSAEAKGIRITSQIADAPAITFDHARIGQVIDNLLTNAVKFSPRDSVIETAVRCRESAIDVVVRDQGLGIPVDEIDKVFAPFQKLSTKPTAGEKSTGLGLAIVKRVVEAHGGDISVESAVGDGSVFTLSLPIERTPRR